MEKWDPDTFDVANDALREAIETGNQKEMSVIASNVRRALNHGEPGFALHDIWHVLDAALDKQVRGIAATLVFALYDYARRCENVALFERLLQHPGSALLQVHNAEHPLPPAFIEHAARVGLSAEPGIRATVVVLLGLCIPPSACRTDEVLSFLVSCLADPPLHRTMDASSRARWQLVRLFHEEGAPKAWLDRLQQLATGSDRAGLSALEVVTALAACRADLVELEALLATKAARFEAALDGLALASRFAQDAAWQKLALELRPILARTKCTKKAAAKLNQLFPAAPGE